MAMQQRRIDALARFPLELNAQSYTTLIRQLDYDVGELWCDVLDFRVKQHQDESRTLGKPLSTKRINAINGSAMACFRHFLATCFERGKSELPKSLDKELLVPVFRVLQRIARLTNKLIFKEAKEEYDAIGRTIDAYNALLAFVDQHNLSAHPELAQEVSMAREMVTLLPTKQRDVQRVFARSA